MPAVTVLGATGKLGLQVVQRLVSHGHGVVPVARTIGRLPPALRDGARPFDLNRPETLPAALDGAELVVSCVHGRFGPLLLQAMPATVQRVVLLGSTRVFTRYPDENVALLQASADALAACGIPGVMLHPTMIYGAAAENNLQRIAAYIRKFGIVPLPDNGRALLQPIHVEDVAACVEAALTRDTAPGAPIIVAGPAPVSYRDLVMQVGAAIGKHPLVLSLPDPLLEMLAGVTALLPFLPTIKRDEIRRLSEDKAFAIDEMQRRLGVTPMSLQQGLRKTFGSKPAA